MESEIIQAFSMDFYNKVFKATFSNITDSDIDMLIKKKEGEI